MLSWRWAWTHSKSSQATQHLSPNTGGDRSQRFSQTDHRARFCLKHPLQGASSHLCCCLSHANCSERRQATGCRKLHENRFQLLRTSAFKELKLDRAMQITQDFPPFLNKRPSLYILVEANRKLPLLPTDTTERPGSSGRTFGRAAPPSLVGESGKRELPATSQSQGSPSPCNPTWITGEYMWHRDLSPNLPPAGR